MLPGQQRCQGETGFCSHLIQMGDWCDLHHQRNRSSRYKELSKNSLAMALLRINASPKGESFSRTIDSGQLMGDSGQLMGDPILESFP
jgi:hypothetical protein